MSGQGKRRDHKNNPPPRMIGVPCPHVDWTLDESLQGPFHCLAHEVELPQHVQEIIGIELMSNLAWLATNR
jgi:hypothetical protein